MLRFMSVCKAMGEQVSVSLGPVSLRQKHCHILEGGLCMNIILFVKLKAAMSFLLSDLLLLSYVHL